MSGLKEAPPVGGVPDADIPYEDISYDDIYDPDFRDEEGGSDAPSVGGRDRFVGAEPLDVLKTVFGFPAFRGLQGDAVARMMAGADTLVLMPTGGGKSVCYQIPALCRRGMGLVVSPLIALMDDQVAALRQLGVNAAALHSELSEDEAFQIRADLADGRLDILYVSPERLLSPGTLDRLTRQSISVIAIDEAHCISAWGHEFRPEYRALESLPRNFPGVPRIALTATADPRTRDDILSALAMPHAEVLSASFHRPNLIISARPKGGETKQLIAALDRRRGDASIVYCGSRARTERTAATLRDKGFPACAYHAGLSPQEKRAALHRFRSGEPIVMVATIAFGMGIDRPDVRAVVHLDMPSSAEAYYQQIGRAGRDGLPSDTLLLYGGEDMTRARYWLDQSTAPESEKRVMKGRLEAMIALTETTSCRTRALLACFGEVLPEPCGHCDNCRSPAPTFDGTEAARKLLSAVYRTGQRFGALHVISVLRGKASDSASRNGHDKLSVWGIGRDSSETFWRGVVRQLIARGALRMGDEHGGLALNDEVARPILRGDEPVMLREDAIEAESGRKGERRNDSPADDLPEDARRIFDALKLWRRAEAREQEIPPYVIFHDATLRDIALEQPGSLAELGRVKGVGGSKLDRYGEAVLRTLLDVGRAA
ncbi:ATP-dependent DNA helicase RecQ [Acetobacter nitrogenifigens DSM 23921 = NBRC 105050]|uniref:DNA helicase RecQ n=1 Tax=Acetobacter nitrogenifigens DSM 23921 = NBRC 105050 TaxID=1120919 RepID=A0A511X8F7_9PROT|nr:ATP-dependent DNA helicase RecQ [Acetobacter nitrogenifigens DSM 23921 = NBRC 105050]GEN59219.1 ATP-dependent DNA helicase RecQ [Acetobacter nitrogenifigens DSM 23921 = NBRC 105050]